MEAELEYLQDELAWARAVLDETAAEDHPPGLPGFPTYDEADEEDDEEEEQELEEDATMEDIKTRFSTCALTAPYLVSYHSQEAKPKKNAFMSSPVSYQLVVFWGSEV